VASLLYFASTLKQFAATRSVPHAETIGVGYFLKATTDVYRVIGEALPDFCRLVTLSPDESPVAAIPAVQFLIAGKVTRQMIEAAPSLRLIQTPGAGYDGIDLEAAADFGVPVACTTCGNTDEVAEHTIMLMLAVSRRLVELDSALRQGRWLMWDRRVNSRNLAERTLGLIGFGRIGQAVARRAQSFGMNVQYSDPIETGGWLRVPLEELLATSDYVSLHVPLTSSTRGLLSEDRLRLMKPDAILINTARGEVVDEKALIDALSEGRLAGAGLDVFEAEPLARTSQLTSMANVVLTPHTGAGTLDGLRVKAQRYAANIRRVMAGETVLDLVSAEAPESDKLMVSSQR
jgi:phosphoglycerate dehydrogenase-like enzyme